VKADGGDVSVCECGLRKGTRSLPRGRSTDCVDKSAQLSSPMVASCLLAGACWNATSWSIGRVDRMGDHQERGAIVGLKEGMYI
jgi:hypothetical protein